MSFLDSIKKGLFDQEDDYEDQYIDDGPQMVNNIPRAPRRTARWSTSMPPLSSRWCW